MAFRRGRGRGIISRDERDKNKPRAKLPLSFLGKIVSLFFVSIIIYIIYLYAKYF
jgi:hypothetical protein